MSTVGCALLVAACAGTQPRELEELTGQQMYESLCSSCHGVGGKGDGPVASLMKTAAPDLTKLAWRDGGEFPTEDVRRTIDGRWDKRAHGDRDMPVWGWRLFDISRFDTSIPDGREERARVNSMIDKLVDYLHSIQEK
jgi:mono/diheme cytochrome c family protein